MSVSSIVIIPENPNHRPTVRRTIAAEIALKKITGSTSDVYSADSVEVLFQDCGTRTEDVFCPNCGSELDEVWWRKAMDDDYDARRGFLLQTVELPCCGKNSDLHKLRYRYPQGFCKYSLKAENPEIQELQKREIVSIEAIFKTKIRVIYRDS